MADEPGDRRPRRRLFGRRRVQEPATDSGQVDVIEADPIEPERPVESNGHPESRAPVASQPSTNHGADPVVPATPAIARPVAPPPAREPHVDLPPEPVGARDALAPESGRATDGDAQARGEDPDPMRTVEPDRPSAAAETEPPPTPEPLAPEPDPADRPAAEPAPVVAEGAHTAPEPEQEGTLPTPRVIAIANQKGGVGKTTTAVNLGAALAEVGFRVLVVDLDPQGNASTGLGINPRDVEASVYDVIMTETPALDCVEPTSLKNLFVLPATIDLAGAEIELVAAFSRELKLRRALDTVRAEYDVILIDCPPSLGLLTVNGLAAADDVIVPVQSEYYALEGLGQLLKNVAMVRSLNPTLDVRGIVLTMHDSRTKLAEQVESEVREHFGTKVYKTVVPRTVRLSEAPSFGQPIIVFDPTSRGASAYRELAKEVSGGATRRTG